MTSSNGRRLGAEHRLWKAVVALATVAALAAAAHAQVPSGGTGGLVLFTPAEAEQLRLAPDESPLTFRMRGAANGPRVIIEKPAVIAAADGDTIELTTPGTLFVRFEPNHAPIDMDTLQVTARKGFFSKSLTSLLKPYVRGTTLQVTELSVPAGRFLIEVDIADTGGAETAADYRLLVNAR